MRVRVASVLRAAILAAGAVGATPGLPASGATGPLNFASNAVNFSSNAITFAANSMAFTGGELRYSGGVFEFRSTGFEFRQADINFRTELQWSETTGQVEIILAADTLFEDEKVELRPTAGPDLHEVADMIRSKAICPVTIRGFSDRIGTPSWLQWLLSFTGVLGTDAANRRRSEQRALSVKTWLETQDALPAASLLSEGVGSRDPEVPNIRADGSDDPDGRQRNRRIKIIIPKRRGADGRCV